MCLGVVGKGNFVAELLGQLLVKQGHRAVDGYGMAATIGAVVGQHAKREGELVGILRLVNQRFDKVSASDAMYEVAEEFVGERIIPYVLNNASTVRVGVGFTQRVLGGIRIAA